MKSWLSVLALVATLGGPVTNGHAQTTPSAAAGDWPQPNFDYSNTRAATNSVISSSNVGELGVGWTFGVNAASAFGALASTPVVVNGTVYLQDLKSNVYAIDVHTGTLKWQKQYNADTVGPNGPAIDSGKVFVAWTANLPAPDFGGATVVGDLVFTSTYAGEVLAFDRGSGAQVWAWQAPAGINGFLSVAGDTLLIPVGLGDAPQLIALQIGAASQSTAPPPAAAQLTISTPAASALSFSTTTLSAAAGAQVTLTYTNNSNLQHNWHLFDGADGGAPSIAATQVMSGPGAVDSVQFTAPSQPGSYFYWCDIHPTIMTGHLTVSSTS